MRGLKKIMRQFGRVKENLRMALDRANVLSIAFCLLSVILFQGIGFYGQEVWAEGGYDFVWKRPELPQPWYFNWPSGVAVDSSGNVYVATSDRIQKFDSSGNFITKWGSLGSGDGQFYHPSGVAIDSSGNVYVADIAFKINILG